MDNTTMTVRERVGAAAWIGLGGGLAWGLVEAGGLLARNAAGSTATLAGVAAAAGFLLALHGLLSALALAGLALIISQVAWVRGRFVGAAWGALCAGLLTGLFALTLGLDQLGVLAGVVRGARAALLAALSLGLAALLGAGGFWLARAALSALSAAAARWLRWAAAGLLGLAALLPLGFALLGGGR